MHGEERVAPTGTEPNQPGSVPQRPVVCPWWAPGPLPLDVRHVEQHQRRPPVGEKLRDLRRANLGEVERGDLSVVLERGGQSEGEQLGMWRGEPLGPTNRRDVVLLALD